MSQTNYEPLIGPTTALINQDTEMGAAMQPDQFQGPTLDGSAASQLSTTSKRFKLAEIYGYKATSDSGAPTDNTGNVWLGFKVDGVLHLTDLIEPGAYVIIHPPEFGTDDLQDLWIWGGTASDSAFVRYN